MIAPPPLSHWLEDKCMRFDAASVRVKRTTTESWVRHTGGRILKAGLSASIEQSDTLEIEITADGAPEEYMAAVRDGVVTALLARSWIPVLRVRVRLYAFEVDPEGSCYAAFYSVARQATDTLLGVKEGTVFNIASPGE